jgi:hypothetical protein
VSSLNDGVAGFTSVLGKSGVFGLNSTPNGPPGTVEFPRPAQVGFGVFGRCDLSGGAGVGGRSEGVDQVTGFGGTGVIGTSQAGDGVLGATNKAGRSGVVGLNDSGTGVFGRSGTGFGVDGFSGQLYGGHFTGGLAPIRLVPSQSAGAPTAGNHQVGELFVDSSGSLFFCKVSGTPGTFVKIA